MESKVLLHAWTLEKRLDDFFLPYTHWIYLKEIIKYYDQVVLLAPCRKLNEKEDTDFICIKDLQNVTVYELPYASSYISVIKHFFKYMQAYKKIENVTTYYARYPVPFGWLQKIYGKNSRRIIHYVGDPVDAAKNNPNFSKLKKNLLISAFKPENALYNWACLGATVYTNGYALAQKLRHNNIEATPVISSTLHDEDFYFEDKVIDVSAPKIIYVGYLRKAKGVETLLKAFALLIKEIPNAKLTIVGNGDFESVLKDMTENLKIRNVSFTGHVDKREALNDLLRSHDIFCFASLSEGSPRVILEAMANGLAVVSTPVGSLPHEFKDNKDILFADFKDEHDFNEKLLFLIKDKETYYNMRERSFTKVKKQTINVFIKSVFHES